MKKQQKTQRKALELNREVLQKLQDETLTSIAGGCRVAMPFTCTCPITIEA